MAQNDFCSKLMEKRYAMFPVECGLCSVLSKNADERFQPHLFFPAARDYKTYAMI